MPRPSRPVPEALRPFITYLWGRTEAGRPDKISASTAAAYQSALVGMYAGGGFENPSKYVTNLGLSGKPDLAKMSSTAYNAWSQWYHAQPKDRPEPSAPAAVVTVAVPVEDQGELVPFAPLPPPPTLVTIPGLQSRPRATHSPLVARIIATMKAARFSSERELATTPWRNVTDAAAEGLPATGPGLCLKIGYNHIFIPCESAEEVARIVEDAQAHANTFIIS